MKHPAEINKKGPNQKMSNFVNKRSTSGLALSLMSGAAVSVLAADAALAQDEIIVSATKREQTLQEVPIAVSVVDGDVIEDAQIIDLIDLQATVPSLRVTQLQNSSQTNFVIRGFGNGANNPGIESAVGVFVDGVFRSRSASAILDLPTLERVEVLRGPQSTLFGKNVSVGAISLSTKKPSFDWEGKVEATYGNLDTVRFRGTLSGPITDTLAFRVSGTTNSRDGQYENIVTGQDNINERDRWAVRGQLLWEPIETLSFRAIGEYNKIEEICCGAIQIINGPATQLIAAPTSVGGLGQIVTPVQSLDARQVALDTLPENELIGRGGSLQADWDLGWGQVTSITAYREQTDFNNTDVDFSGADLAVQPQDQLSETFTQELRISGYTETGFGNFNWIAGGFYFDETLEFERDVIFGDDLRAFVDAQLGALGTSVIATEGATQVAQALTTGPTALFPEFQPAGGAGALAFGSSFAPGTGVFGDYLLENDSYSLFGQVDWEVTERLTITGGISYVNDEKEAIGNSLLTDTFSAFDLNQLITSGPSFIAAGAFSPVAGGTFATLPAGAVPINPLTGVAFSAADFTFNPANPVPFFTNAGALAAVNPALFNSIRGGAVGIAQAQTDPALGGSPLANPLIGLTGLDVVQFFDPQVNFPQAGATRDDINGLSDDGFVQDDDVNYTARIAYDLNDAFNVYFSYATGFKASAVNLSSDSFVPTQAVDGAGNPLNDEDGNPVIIGRFADPESTSTFELGLKAQFDGGFVNVAVFTQDVTNFQQNAFTGAAFALINAGETRTRGFEVDAAYSPIDALNLSFGLTYLDPEITSFPNAPCNLFFEAPECQGVPGTTIFDASGRRPAGIHEVSLTAAATYTMPVTASSELSGRVEYVYESETPVIDNGPASITREVNLINANLRWQHDGGMFINGFVRNLTDDDFLLSAFPTVVQAGSFSGYVNQQRTYGVSIGFEF